LLFLDTEDGRHIVWGRSGFDDAITEPFTDVVVDDHSVCSGDRELFVENGSHVFEMYGMLEQSAGPKVVFVAEYDVVEAE